MTVKNGLGNVKRSPLYTLRFEAWQQILAERRRERDLAVIKNPGALP